MRSRALVRPAIATMASAALVAALVAGLPAHAADTLSPGWSGTVLVVWSSSSTDVNGGHELDTAKISLDGTGVQESGTMIRQPFIGNWSYDAGTNQFDCLPEDGAPPLPVGYKATGAGQVSGNGNFDSTTGGTGEMALTMTPAGIDGSGPWRFAMSGGTTDSNSEQMTVTDGCGHETISTVPPGGHQPSGLNVGEDPINISSGDPNTISGTWTNTSDGDGTHFGESYTVHLTRLPDPDHDGVPTTTTTVAPTTTTVAPTTTTVAPTTTTVVPTTTTTRDACPLPTPPPSLNGFLRTSYDTRLNVPFLPDLGLFSAQPSITYCYNGAGAAVLGVNGFTDVDTHLLAGTILETYLGATAEADPLRTATSKAGRTATFDASFGIRVNFFTLLSNVVPGGVSGKLGELAAAKLGPRISRIVARYGSSPRAVAEIERAVDDLIRQYKSLARTIAPRLKRAGVPDQIVSAVAPVLRSQLFNLFDSWRLQIGDLLHATSLDGANGTTVALDLYNWLRDKIDAIASRYFPLWTPHITFTVFNDGRVEHRDTGWKVSQALLPTRVSESTSQR